MPGPEADYLSQLRVTVRPANQVSFQDIQTVFGPKGGEGSAHYCQCQRFKTPSSQWWDEQQSRVPVPARARRLYDESGFADPDAAQTSGLVAFAGREPVGWCRVGPRSTYLRLGRVPFTGRTEDRKDERAWAAVCFITRAEYRHHRLTYRLVQAAVDFAHARGASAIEGYPMVPEPGHTVTWGELSVGKYTAFVAAGFREVSHPTLRRVVMRIDFEGDTRTASERADVRAAGDPA